MRRGAAAGDEHVHVIAVQEEVEGKVVTPADVIACIDAAMRMSSSSRDLKAAAAAPGLPKQAKSERRRRWRRMKGGWRRAEYKGREWGRGKEEEGGRQEVEAGRGRRGQRVAGGGQSCREQSELVTVAIAMETT